MFESSWERLNKLLLMYGHFAVSNRVNCVCHTAGLDWGMIKTLEIIETLRHALNGGVVIVSSGRTFATLAKYMGKVPQGHFEEVSKTRWESYSGGSVQLCPPSERLVGRSAYMFIVDEAVTEEAKG